MPSFSRGNDGLDKEYFEELQEKCRFLGISLKEKDFRKNPDKYIEAARNYDERVKDYLHERQDRLKSLQEQFAREDNIPAFMALGKARMVLTGEVHRQMLAEKMAETAFAKIEEEYNFSVKDLHNKRNRDKFERLAYAFAISPQDLANQLQDAGNIGEAFAGRVAGVQVTSNEGMPGEEMNIVIRGSNSVTQSNSPLYVIDGFPLEDTSMGALNPSDIASISILKDASATAIYGARAANGVVIITTKLGTPGTTKVTFDASWGFAQISKKIDLMNAYEFVTLQQEIMTEADFNKTYLGEGGARSRITAT